MLQDPYQKPSKWVLEFDEAKIKSHTQTGVVVQFRDGIKATFLRNHLAEGSIFEIGEKGTFICLAWVAEIKMLTGDRSSIQ